MTGKIYSWTNCIFFRKSKNVVILQRIIRQKQVGESLQLRDSSEIPFEGRQNPASHGKEETVDRYREVEVFN